MLAIAATLVKLCQIVTVIIATGPKTTFITIWDGLVIAAVLYFAVIDSIAIILIVSVELSRVEISLTKLQIAYFAYWLPRS